MCVNWLVTQFMLIFVEMVVIWESTKRHLCSTLSLFKMSWQMLKVLPQPSPFVSSLPYLRAFKWGTLWPCTSWGIKHTTSQSWKCLYLLNKSWTINFDLSYFWYPLSYRVIQYLIWKLSDMIKMSRGLSCGSTSRICQGILKSDILLHKQGFVDSQIKYTVSCSQNGCLRIRGTSAAAAPEYRV